MENPDRHDEQETANKEVNKAVVDKETDQHFQPDLFGLIFYKTARLSQQQNSVSDNK